MVDRPEEQVVPQRMARADVEAPREATRISLLKELGGLDD